ncbi:MAG: hypothetical protein M3Y27_09710, partial [Acidobacteriota bacterium]|nr:hypothetical protein [Acidobacteriota bacterium]
YAAVTISGVKLVLEDSEASLLDRQVGWPFSLNTGTLECCTGRLIQNVENRSAQPAYELLHQNPPTDVS